jgi:putative FmdB family regulatory protein
VPTYDYVCSTCGRRFEVVHGVNDAGPETCPNCGAATVRKAFSPPSIHFKGTGWAKKERHSSSARKSGSGSASEASSGETKDGAKDAPKVADAGKPDGGGAAKDGGASKAAAAGPSGD